MADQISKSKISDVNTRLQAMGVRDKDLREEFIKGSGSGGQKINKTSSCVQLTYLKTGFVVKCQQSRSREQNRFFARRLLLEKIEQDALGKKSEKAKKIHKIRAQKKKRSKRAKEKMVEVKRMRGDTKKLRRKPTLTS